MPRKAKAAPALQKQIASTIVKKYKPKRAMTDMQNNKKTLQWVIWILMLLIVTMGLCAYLLLTANYLTIKAPYAGYELGYDPVRIDSELLCSPTMKDRSAVSFDSDLLTDTETYLYKESDKSVITKKSKKNILRIGKYSVTAKLNGASDSVLLSVFDTIAPRILNQYTTTPLKVVNPEDVQGYIEVDDYSEELTLTTYYDKEEKTIRLLITDEGYNSAESVWRIELVKEGRQTPLPDGMKEYSLTYRQEDSLDSYNESVAGYEKQQQELVEREDKLQKDLLKDEYETVKDELNKRHEEIENDQPEPPTQTADEDKPKKDNNDKDDKEDTDKNNTDDKDEESDEPTACTDTPPRGYFVHESTARGSTPKGYVFKGWIGNPIEVCGRVYRKANYQPTPNPTPTPTCEATLPTGYYRTEQEAINSATYPKTAVIDKKKDNCGDWMYFVKHQGYRTWVSEEDKKAWESATENRKGSIATLWVKTPIDTDMNKTNSAYKIALIEYLESEFRDYKGYTEFIGVHKNNDIIEAKFRK